MPGKLDALERGQVGKDPLLGLANPLLQFQDALGHVHLVGGAELTQLADFFFQFVDRFFKFEDYRHAG